MFENGSDIVEIGVPFSDPVAEGKTVQEASLRSLANGTDLTKILGTVAARCGSNEADWNDSVIVCIGTYFIPFFKRQIWFEIVEKYGQDSVQKVGEFVSSLKKAVK